MKAPIMALAVALTATPAAAIELTSPNGTDDTAAIQAQIGGGGRGVRLGPGTWHACGLTIGNATSLSGYGAASALVKTATCASPLLSLTDPTSSNVTLSDLTLNGKGLPGGLVNFTNDGALNHGSHNIHGLTLINDAGNCLTMGYGTRDSIIEHVRVYQCGGYGIIAAGDDSQYGSIDVGSTGLAGFYADDSNPTVAGLKVWMAGYGTADQPGVLCYHCTGTSFSALFTQDNGGAGFQGSWSDHIYIQGQSDSDNGAGDSEPAVKFTAITNASVSIQFRHRAAGLGTVTAGFYGDAASTPNVVEALP